MMHEFPVSSLLGDNATLDSQKYFAFQQSQVLMHIGQTGSVTEK